MIKWRRKPDGSGLRNAPERRKCRHACLLEFQLEGRKTEEGAPTLKMQNVGGPMTFNRAGYISYYGCWKLVFLVSEKKNHN